MESHQSEKSKNNVKGETLLKAIDSREDGTCGLIGHKLKLREQAAEKYGLDARTVSRYARLSFLNKALLNRVDDGETGLYPAVSLSYLTPGEQTEYFANKREKEDGSAHEDRRTP